MSAKRWKRARAKPAHEADAIDREKRDEIRAPWRVRAAAWLFGDGIRSRWIARWEKRHVGVLRGLVKDAAHWAMRRRK